VATKANAAKEGSAAKVGVVLLAVAALFALALAAPFLGGASNILGILIIGFGLWRAWQINKPSTLTINGPFSVAPAAHV
jgi:hypothetical protein